MEIPNNQGCCEKTTNLCRFRLQKCMRPTPIDDVSGLDAWKKHENQRLVGSPENDGKSKYGISSEPGGVCVCVFFLTCSMLVLGGLKKEPVFIEVFSMFQQLLYSNMESLKLFLTQFSSQIQIQIHRLSSQTFLDGA